MKKLFAILFAVMMLASMATVASAESTTLVTNVPAAAYTLNIPAEGTEVPFGTTEMDIGNFTVTGSSGFAEGKNLSVTVTYTPFTADGVSTEIPYTLKLLSGTTKKELASGSTIVFKGKADGSVNEKTMIPTAGNMGNYSDSPVSAVLLTANSDAWGKALAGDYTSTLTFTCEVVVE